LLGSFIPKTAYAVNGSRHIETFERKKDADDREAEVTVNIGKGVHTPTSKSATVAHAGELWIKACEGDELESHPTSSTFATTSIPTSANLRLAMLTVPLVRKFKDHLRDAGRSPAMVAWRCRGVLLVRTD